MTLEHLIMVGEGMSNIVAELGQKSTPLSRVNSAEEKPKVQLEVGKEIETYEKFLNATLKKLDCDVQDRKSKTKFDYSWFGNLTANKWVWI